MVTRRQLRKIKQSRRKFRQRGGGGELTISEQSQNKNYENTFKLTFTLQDEDLKEKDKFKERWSNFYVNANRFFTLTYSNSNFHSRIKAIKEISTEYDYFINLQNFPLVAPGDILFYLPNAQYKFGHIETVLGTFTDSGDQFISKTTPLKSPNSFLPTMFGEMHVTFKMNRTLLNPTIYKLQYKNPLIRATAAFLSKLFLENKLIEYGVRSIISKYLTKFISGPCIETSQEELIRRVYKTLEKIGTGEKVSTVCSGFTILMYELAFLIQGEEMNLVTDMPFDAKGCSPIIFFEHIKTLTNTWKVIEFPYTAIRTYPVKEPSILSLMNTTTTT